MPTTHTPSGGKLREQLYIYSMGKRFKVEAMFPDSDDGTRSANEYMERHRELGVMAVAGGQVFLCSKYDGITVTP